MLRTRGILIKWGSVQAYQAMHVVVQHPDLHTQRHTAPRQQQKAQDGVAVQAAWEHPAGPAPEWCPHEPGNYICAQRVAEAP
mmetsp:Transcript_40160/g.89102  ORF Transcript_40160/g.89102 Transcript_40160/m.89102 type:complete len:82 (+) Transcript_40160:116-361(+)